MIRTGRSAEVTQATIPEGSSVRLVEKTRWLHVAIRGRRLAFAYHHPHHVEWHGQSTRIVDHLGMARLLAVTTLLLSVVTRRRSR